MILYTMTPYDEIFPPTDQDFTQHQTIPINGGQLVVEPLQDGRFKVVRLVSGDVGLYLQDQFSPGAIIEANHLI